MHYYAGWCSHGREDVVWKVGESATKNADKQSASRAGSARREARRTGIVTGCIVEKESRHEARQEVTGASEIEVLLLPELSRDERA